jgi:hypothetical protein
MGIWFPRFIRLVRPDELGDLLAQGSAQDANSWHFASGRKARCNGLLSRR